MNDRRRFLSVPAIRLAAAALFPSGLLHTVQTLLSAMPIQEESIYIPETG